VGLAVVAASVVAAVGVSKMMPVPPEVGTAVEELIVGSPDVASFVVKTVGVSVGINPIFGNAV